MVPFSANMYENISVLKHKLFILKMTTT